MNQVFNENNKQLITSVILHASDISTSLRDFNTSVKWAELLFEEFYIQGDFEKANGFKISNMCDRTQTDIENSQYGFI